MFVQVIEGRVQDAERLHSQLDRWARDLRPGATGFLGTTAGVADDGRAIAFARFESAEAARANSERSEQGAWWADTEGCFDGEVTFSDSENVDLLGEGGSDDAGFVQAMKGGGDRERLRAMDERFAAHASSFRPDVLGGTRVWTSEDRYIELVYFTSEADARANESKEPPPELAGDIAEFGDLMQGIEFIDLRTLWLY
jgi:hypothetical protein